MLALVGWIAFAIMAIALAQGLNNGILKDTESTFGFFGNAIVFGYILWSLVG